MAELANLRDMLSDMNAKMAALELQHSTQLNAQATELARLGAQNTLQQQSLQQAELLMARQAAAHGEAIVGAQTASVQASAAAASSAAKQSVDMRPVTRPKALLAREGWEMFEWQATTYPNFVDSEYKSELDMATRESQIMDNSLYTPETEKRSNDLYAMLTSWTQDFGVCAMISRSVEDLNGFELWRQLHTHFNPETEGKSLTWRRSLLRPVFPTKESEWATALTDWETDVGKYEAAYKKHLDDEDKRAVILEVAPQALKQHLSQNIGKLKSYDHLREQIVSHLQSKQVCHREAGNYYGAAKKEPKKDPNAMQIDAFGDGKGKGKKVRVIRARMPRARPTARMPRAKPRARVVRTSLPTQTQAHGTSATSAGTDTLLPIAGSTQLTPRVMAKVARREMKRARSMP